jgi:hypothetical protein
VSSSSFRWQPCKIFGAEALISFIPILLLVELVYELNFFHKKEMLVKMLKQSWNDSQAEFISYKS